MPRLPFTGLPPDPETGRYPGWESLRWFLFVRLLLAVALMRAFSPAGTDPLIPRMDAVLAWRVLVGYAVLVLASGLLLYARWPSRRNQVYLAVFIDLAAFTLLMHAGGGVGSGLGVLLAFAVTTGALLMEGRVSLLFAALASLAVIGEQTYGLLGADAPASAYTQAGLLGIVFFAVALLAHGLSKRLQAMEALAARRKVDLADLSKLNEFIIQTLSTGLVVTDGKRRFRLMNRAAGDLLGIGSAPAGTQLGDLSPELDAWLASHLHPGTPPTGLVRIGNRELRPVRQLLGDDPTAGVLLYLRDQEELVREAQQIKLASLGTLTASIAHNIRNPLSAISHASQLLAEAPQLTADDRHLLAIVQRNSDRIDGIIQSILQLSRRDQMRPRALDLATWTQEFSGEFREHQDLAAGQFLVTGEPPPIPVIVDPRHLHQIVSNLCENALVHAGRPQPGAPLQLRVSRAPEPDKALLEVLDQGPGIDAGTAQEIFNPFFTTRSGGTGLGLYIARELAETNGIRLQYERLEPRGSCFRLIFSA